MTELPIESWTIPSVIGEADLYQYAELLRWAPGPLRIYVGLYPDTDDDVTPGHLRELCERDGFGGYISISCFNFRAP